ncbi:Rab7 [Reticulomyxa filosa]|uniref:Ras-related protein Rab-7b n=1 Tax=Reticulomyxa filosa TaxID=46433 RepID=X6N108_RETFI|nr:Rab7 [Reticulomyxa filosa]|eukprot:ETO19012.1 Rab7 [Reticulomyxa filosa]
MTAQPKKKVLLKIIILGDSGVGKTALLHRYVHGQFIQEHKATIGADFITKDISVEDKMIWDTSGQERFQSLGTAFFRGADACVLVYDITNDQSFKQIEMWRSSFLEQSSPPDAEKFPFLLCGNKHDLQSTRAVSAQDGEQLAHKYRMQFFETSALDGNNVEAAIRKIASVTSDLDTAPWIWRTLKKEQKLLGVHVKKTNTKLESFDYVWDSNSFFFFFAFCCHIFFLKYMKMKI